MSAPWHTMKIEDALHKLQSDRRGLSEEAKRRLQEIGPNELAERKRITPLQIFLNQFKDIFVIMLLAAILLSVVAGYYKSQTASNSSGLLEYYADAITIGAIVVLNAIVGFIQEYRSEKAMEAMKKLTAPKARLIRSGKEVTIPAREVVPGDVVLLEAGDRVPADARLMETINLRTDEAILTGESIPVDKGTGTLRTETPVANRKNMIFMATHAIYGRGRAVVTSTGMKTEFGRIAEMIQTAEEERPLLKIKLENFARRLAVIVTLVCALIFLLEGMKIGWELGALAEAFLSAIALAVSAVPEGLPAIVTVTLTLGARELARRNAVIRRLASAETLGSTTVICSDKTGTLTKGEMTVRKIYTNRQTIEVTGVGYEAKGEYHRDSAAINPQEDDSLTLILRIGALCNNARYDGRRIIGDTTEGALIVAAAKAGMQRDEMKKDHPRIGEIPFSSERKLMTTVHQTPEGKKIAYVKGAPEVVLKLSSHIHENARVRKLNEDKRRRILRVNEEMAGEALRVLGMAYKELPKTLKNFTEKGVEKGLTFVGLTGMIDPPRAEAKEANRLCEQAGIKTVMITGDHRLTAVAIAKELGMLKSGLTLTGEELNKLSDEEFEKIVEGVSVYARVLPEHKMRIVKALKKKGHIVAMTGDGVNDAPALKQADIGVAMGITGTDVTKEASDMVLADDNFATIVNAVKEGRIIYDNIRKFAFFLMRSNFDELLIIGSFALAGLPLPLTAAMILWINLATDGGPAVALSMDPPVEDVMQRPPRNPKEGVLHGRLASILATFLTQALGTALVFYLAYFVFGKPLKEARTMAFAQAVMQELIIVWNCRSEKHNAFRVGFTSNRFLLLSVVVSFLLTVSLFYVPILQLMFDTVPLSAMDWVIVSSVACSGFLIAPEIFYGRRVWRWE